MDGEKFYLYKFSGEISPPDESLSIKVFHSSLKNPVFSMVCKAKKAADYNDLYTELRWMIATHLRCKIYYIEKDNVIVHSSFCTSKTFKFPFFKEKDLQIGPCFTDPAYRGKGIYGKVLTYIASDLKRNPDCGDLYMIIEENNTASREGVKKAGFAEVAELYRKGRLKRYYVRKWL